MSYSLEEVLSGRGWPRGVRFIVDPGFVEAEGDWVREAAAVAVRRLHEVAGRSLRIGVAGTIEAEAAILGDFGEAIVQATLARIHGSAKL